MARLGPLLLSTILIAGCDADEDGAAEEATAGALDLEGEAASPPFDVRGDAEGLLLVWFDATGPHAAERRDEIPEARRAQVRVDSLRLPPEERLDPAWVWIADLRAPREGGSYAVRKLRREAFEALIDRAGGARVAAAQGADAPGAATSADVIIYGAQWCGACKQAARFFRDHGVAFVEKDVERDPEALREMQDKARRAGVRPGGIPIIDFRGTLLTGFDPSRLRPLVEGRGAPI